MITFALTCALMLLLAMAWLAWPLLRRVEGESAAARLSIFIFTSVSVVLLTTAIYLGNTNWSWQAGTSIATSANTSAMNDSPILKSLQQKTRAAPNDINAWLELGQAYVGVGNYVPASTAYQQAYDLSQGKNIDAITGLAEALVLADPATLNGRVGLLIEQALQLQPNQPKALWYGGMVALQLENLPLARDRFTALLALNPPAQVRSLLERQIQDIAEQLGEANSSIKPAAMPKSNRKVVVKVSLSAAIKARLSRPVALFVLARNPQQPGPPLAVERHQSTELPLQVELTTDDAMLPTRTLADAADVEIVARLSASGMPTEQSGDYYGRTTYSFAKGEQGSVTVEINQQVK
jgi:cytochrome c-type biogenesis protein CcmH